MGREADRLEPRARLPTILTYLHYGNNARITTTTIVICKGPRLPRIFFFYYFNNIIIITTVRRDAADPYRTHARAPPYRTYVS